MSIPPINPDDLKEFLDQTTEERTLIPPDSIEYKNYYTITALTGLMQEYLKHLEKKGTRPAEKTDNILWDPSPANSEDQMEVYLPMELLAAPHLADFLDWLQIREHLRPE